MWDANIVAGKESWDPVISDKSFSIAFQQAHETLSSCEVITFPQPDDYLRIVTYGAVTYGVGTTLYIAKQGKPRLAGFLGPSFTANKWSDYLWGRSPMQQGISVSI